LLLATVNKRKTALHVAAEGYELDILRKYWSGLKGK